jgi:DNA-binding transcriptional LysR family regulator
VDIGGTDLNLLVALKALLEERNVTHAGARIGISQPTMSGILARLRRHYRDELLVRVGRDSELTPLGAELLPAVRESVRLMTEALRLSPDFDPATSDRLFSLIVSDYAMTVLHQPLLRRVRQAAPAVRLEFSNLQADILGSERSLLRHDFLVGPLGYPFPGTHEPLFADRLVCIVDAANPRLRDGKLGFDDLAELPHAVASFRGTTMTPADRVLDELGVVRRISVRTLGFLPLPFVIQGTDAVAIVPERLARRFARDRALAVVDPPFGRVEMVEALWWHPTRATDPGASWLLSVLREVAAELGAG